MKRAEFIAQLKEMGLQPEEAGGDYITFPYKIPVGRFAGTSIRLGFLVKDLIPPPGLHLAPPLLPLHPASDIPHPNGGIHDSAPHSGNIFGAGWQYWSRPFSGWTDTDRSARTYMAHVTNLFDFP
jgi:hypothetical protein